MSRLKVTRNINGVVVSIHFNRGDEQGAMWASLPYDGVTKAWNPQTELDHALLAEAQALPEWEDLDLGDRPDLAPPAYSPPDWNAFYDELEDSQIELKLFGSTDKISLQKLTLEFSKRGDGSLSVDNLKRYWDKAVSSVNLTEQDIEQVNEWATEANLAVRIATNKTMVDA